MQQRIKVLLVDDSEENPVVPAGARCPSHLLFFYKPLGNGSGATASIG
jgi:hypothetical protein